MAVDRSSSGQQSFTDNRYPAAQLSSTRASVGLMVWFYTRNNQKLTLETRYDNATDEFVATLTGLAGPPITKRFTTADAFREWIVTLENDLAAGKWEADGPPHILPDGWRDKPWSL